MDKSDIEYLENCLAKTYDKGTPFTNVWYSHNETMIIVARLLDDEQIFVNTGSVIYFFDKPWKYEVDMQRLVDEYKECHATNNV